MAEVAVRIGECLGWYRRLQSDVITVVLGSDDTSRKQTRMKEDGCKWRENYHLIASRTCAFPASPCKYILGFKKSFFMQF